MSRPSLIDEPFDKTNGNRISEHALEYVRGLSA